MSFYWAVAVGTLILLGVVINIAIRKVFGDEFSYTKDACIGSYIFSGVVAVIASLLWPLFWSLVFIFGIVAVISMSIRKVLNKRKRDA